MDSKENVEKEVLCIGVDGRVLSETSEYLIHDKIIYEMFKEVLDGLSEMEKDTIKTATKLNNFEDSLLKNGATISFWLKELVIYDSKDRVLIIIPPQPNKKQFDYFCSNYLEVNKRTLAFYFENGLQEIYDLSNIENSKKIIFEKFEYLSQENELNNNLSI